ncbi:MULTISPECIES: SH3 domain-containing protein [Xanthobacter]|uniref:SH3 domain-containing protein n=1 Tax=Xanthobacter TaxID=279 RepID=UPI001F3974EC|nr:MULTISPECIES: SH3 domain-containing protein [unclassified Xanthobacter]
MSRHVFAFTLLAASLLAAASPASAQSRCRVTDPTGTPLNVRTAPQGQVVGTIPNGTLVTILDHASDSRGRPWVYVAVHKSGRPLGWVYREFVSCF